MKNRRMNPAPTPARRWMYGSTGLDAGSRWVSFCGELRIAIGYATPANRISTRPTGRHIGPRKWIERITVKNNAAPVTRSKSFMIEYCIGTRDAMSTQVENALSLTGTSVGERYGLPDWRGWSSTVKTRKPGFGARDGSGSSFIRARTFTQHRGTRTRHLHCIPLWDAGSHHRDRPAVSALSQSLRRRSESNSLSSTSTGLRPEYEYDVNALPEQVWTIDLFSLVTAVKQATDTEWRWFRS